MANLSKQTRSPHSPSPIYGDGSLRMNTLAKNVGLLRPGFTIGDFDKQYAGSFLVYGTAAYPSTQWPPTGVTEPVVTQTSTADGSGTLVSPNSRVVRITIHVSGTGSASFTAITAADGTTQVFNSGALTAGSYEFYLGGWASTTSNSDATYLAAQYGPLKPGGTISANDPTGDEELGSQQNTSANSNYVGGGYNPVDYLSLDGYGLTFKSTKSGSPSWDLSVTPVS